MASSKDFRGVERAECSQCSCDQYNGGQAGRKCVDCSHPPGKHHNSLTGAIQSLTPHSPPVSDVDMAVMCLVPQCSAMALFDLNTGVQYSHCSDHHFGSASLPSFSMVEGQAPSLRSALEKITSSGHSRAPVAGIHTSVTPMEQQQQQLFSPTVVPQVPVSNQCKLEGCTRPRFTEPNGRVHEFCGRTHGREYEKQNSSVPAELKCRTPNCYKQRYPNGQGGHFDFCTQYCRDNGSKVGQVQALRQSPANVGPCNMPNCTIPKYFDPANQRVHDFCSRSHAYLARMQGITASRVSIRPANAHETNSVTTTFKTKWKKGRAPDVSFIFRIDNANLLERWSVYQTKIKKTHPEQYYHGTKLTCNITVDSALCASQHCGVCGISSTGLDRRCIRKNIIFQRFGHGFYLAPDSSKCHDYTQGFNNFRAMLQFDVYPGHKYHLKKNNEKLTGPPQGYDSVYGQGGSDSCLNYDELVIYNPDAALPTYIIVYSKDGVGKIAK